MKAYSVYSKVTNDFSLPMFFNSHKEAAHSFIKFIRTVPYEDKKLYSLYCIGSFDKSIGLMEALDDTDFYFVPVEEYSKVLYSDENEDDEEIEV